MKKLFFVLFVVGAATSAPAQGTFQFAANLTLAEPLPPFPFPYTGQGAFTLEGNIFRYSVRVPVYALWSGQIRAPDPDGTVLFDLTGMDCTAPIGDDPGHCTFRGAVALPESWIVDLLANRWYVIATYHDSFPADVHLRGEVVLVPEPSWLALVALCIGLLGVYRWLRGQRHTEKPSQG